MTKNINSQKGLAATAVIISLIVLVAIGAAVYFITRPASAPAIIPGNDQQNSGQSPSGQVREFTLTAKPYSFTPAEISVNKGDTVKITLSNIEGFHDWVIDEFNARTERINAGQTATVQFVADKAGTFEFYCSVGNHRQMGMKGNLIVK